MDVLGAPLTLAIAAVSVACRAGLNVIDRTYFHRCQGSIVTANVINNALPTALIAVPLLVLQPPELLSRELLSPRVIAASLIIQVVAYTFGAALRKVAIPRVLVVSKLPDLVIPWGLMLTVGRADARDWLFSLATVAACLPVFASMSPTERRPRTWLVVMFVALSVQGILSPLLFVPANSQGLGWITFTAAVIAWRLVWSLLVGLLRPPRSLPTEQAPNPKQASLGRKLLILRAFVALATQFTFLLAAGQGIPGLAWPILNSAALVAVVMSSIVLKEHPNRGELLSVMLITGLAIGRASLAS